VNPKRCAISTNANRIRRRREYASSPGAEDTESNLDRVWEMDRTAVALARAIVDPDGIHRNHIQ
jgi:hypothetical protein